MIHSSMATLIGIRIDEPLAARPARCRTGDRPLVRVWLGRSEVCGLTPPMNPRPVSESARHKRKARTEAR